MKLNFERSVKFNIVPNTVIKPENNRIRINTQK